MPRVYPAILKTKGETILKNQKFINSIVIYYNFYNIKAENNSNKV